MVTGTCCPPLAVMNVRVLLVCFDFFYVLLLTFYRLRSTAVAQGCSWGWVGLPYSSMIVHATRPVAPAGSA